MRETDNAIGTGGVTPAGGAATPDEAATPGGAAAPRVSGAPTPGESAAPRAGRAPGVALGALGILAFSFSLPATRPAVAALDPCLVAFGRATVAAVLAAAYLTATRAPRPTRRQVRSLAITAGGVVVGFPLFTSLALQTATAAPGAVVMAFLPAATAVAAVLRAQERPSRRFWLSSGAGLIAVLAFIAGSEGEAVTASGPSAAVFLLAGTALCAIGYAEGGALSRALGAANTIC